MIIIRVVGNDGKGVNYSKVQITWSDGHWSHQVTDSNGYVRFDGEGQGVVYVDGRVVLNEYLRGQYTVLGSH